MMKRLLPKSKFGWATLIGVFVLATVALAAAMEAIPAPYLRLGRRVAETTTIEFYNALATTKKLIISTTGDASLNTNKATMGDGIATGDKRIVFDRGASNPEIRWNENNDNLEFSRNGVDFSAFGTGGGGGGVNFLSVEDENPDFENGTAKWVASTPAHLTEELTDIGAGTKSGRYDPTANLDTLSTADVVVSNALEGKACLWEFYYNWPTGTLTHLNARVELSDGTDITTPIDLNPTTTTWGKFQVGFVCPSNGVTTPNLSIKATITATANANPIILDSYFLGEDKRRGVLGDQSELMGKQSTVCSSFWTVTNTAFAAYSTTTGCTSTDVVTQKTSIAGPTGTAGPIWTLANLPPGRYVAHFDLQVDPTVNIFSDYGATDAATCSDSNVGASAAIGRVHYDAGTFSRQHMTLNLDFEVTTTTTKTLRICGRSSSGQNLLRPDIITGALTFELVRFPNQSPRDTVTLETQGRYWDANIGGAVEPSLGTASVASYSVLSSTTLDLVKNAGSANIGIACDGADSTTTATTCSGNESVGATVDIPYPGTFKMCFAFSHLFNAPADSDVAQTFQVVRTGNANNTFTATTDEGNDRVSTRNKVVGTGGYVTTTPFLVCGLFVEPAATRRTYKLFFEQIINGGSISISNIHADRNAGNGQRDIHFYGYALTQQFPQAVALSSIASAVGVTDGSAAPAGFVGEELSSCSTGIAIATTPVQLRTITLTPGDWDISGQGYFNGAANSALILCVSTTTANCTLGTGGVVRGKNEFNCFINSGTGSGSCFVPGFRASVTTTSTPYFLNGSVNSAGDSGFNGCIRARRVR